MSVVVVLGTVGKRSDPKTVTPSPPPTVAPEPTRTPTPGILGSTSTRLLLWGVDPQSRLQVLDLDSGERALLIPAPDVLPRNVAFAPSGEMFAWTHDVHPGDMMPISTTRACQIFVVNARDPHSGREPVLEVPSGCYEGIGMAFVGDTLWVAPPRE